MRFLFTTITAFILAFQASSAQQNNEITKDGVRVSVLGYHDFSESRPVSDMLIRTSKFRKQMQAIKDLKLNVISLDDFMQWKAGEKDIPDRSILITIDDGWKSVYTDAYPILKEFGYPFAVYLYTNYIDVGGRSMTSAMIKEMQANGCTIGSHSVSHPSPGTVKSKQREDKGAYEKYLHNEYGKSQEILKAKFLTPIDTYVYPGGHFDPDMFPIIDQYNYKYLFTCIPGKTKRDTPDKEVPRYIVLGHNKYDRIFQQATTFTATARSRASAGAIFAETEYPVSPASGDKVKSRLPMISADLSSVAGIDPETVVMRIAGFGKVPATFDENSKTISWTVNRPLRFTTCTVSVQWRIKGNNTSEPTLNWTFVIDREAAYLPKTNS